MPIIVNLDVMMAKRKMSLNELSERVDLTLSNLSILKTGKAKAVRFSTLDAICKALDCQPGELLSYEASDSDAELALHALAEHSLANEVLHLHDGAQALDYLFRQGEFAGRARDDAAHGGSAPVVDGARLRDAIEVVRALVSPRSERRVAAAANHEVV